ncbi:retroelement silencing factor 1 [Pelobates fuscus]|uniref:retroelement silencing factor 1 n=1 Tax=Pelobates fuscus TaxID=191477 RepID=UPI002FE45A95
MAWNGGQNSNGANIRSENQYSLQHTPNTLAPVQKQMQCAPQNACSQSGMNAERFYSNQNSQGRYIEGLLTAKTNEDMCRLENTILAISPYGHTNQIPQNKGSTVSNNVPGNQLAVERGAYQPPDYPTQNLQRMQRANYVAQQYANLSSQQPSKSQQLLQTAPSVQRYNPNGNAVSINYHTLPSQSYQQTVSYGNAQNRGPQPTQNFDKPITYASYRQSRSKVNHSQTILPKVPTSSPAQYNIQKVGAQDLKLSFPSNIASKNSSECLQNLQTSLMPNCQTGQSEGSVLVDRSSESYQINTHSASIPNQPVHNQTTVNASQTFNVQHGQSFSTQAQNYLPQAAQQPVANNPERARELQMLQYIKTLPPNSKAREEFYLLINLYKKVKQNMFQLVLEGERKMQNAQLPVSATQEVVSSYTEAELKSVLMHQPMVSNVPVPPASCRAQQQNVTQSPSFQMRGNGNQANHSSSQKLEPPSQTYNSEGWNVNAQALYSVSGQQNPMNTRNDCNQSSSSDSYKLAQERAVTSHLLQNNSATVNLLQNLNKLLPSSVGNQMECVPQTKTLPQHSDSSASPQMNRRTPNHNVNFLSGVGQTTTVNCENQTDQSNNQTSTLLQQADFSVSPQQSRKMPQFQVNVTLVQSNGPLRNNATMENPSVPSSIQETPSPTAQSADVLSSSLEAIDTCLTMWKTKPHNVSGASQLLLTQNKQTVVDSTALNGDCLNEWLKDPSVICNDAPVSISAISSLKQEAGSAKVGEPQIAIVSPLVQSKIKHHTEVQPQITNEPVTQEATTLPFSITNEKVNSYLASMENIPGTAHGGFKHRLLSELEAVNTVLQTISSGRTMPLLQEDTQNTSFVRKQSINESPNQLLIQTSNEESETEQDGSFQISSICSLAEGNSFYDSSVAMMFVNSSLPQEDNLCLTKTEVQDGQEREPERCSSETPQMEHATVNDDHKLETTDEVKDTNATSHSIALMSEYLHGSDTLNLNVEYSCTEQSPNEMATADLDSTKLSDQLTELLSEFPYGIKNYVSELADKVTNPVSSPIKEEQSPVGNGCSLLEEPPRLQQVLKEEVPSVKTFSMSFKELPQAEHPNDESNLGDSVSLSVKEDLPILERESSLLLENSSCSEKLSELPLPQLERELPLLLENSSCSEKLSEPPLPQLERASPLFLENSEQLSEQSLDGIQITILSQEESAKLFPGTADTELLHDLPVEKMEDTSNAVLDESQSKDGIEKSDKEDVESSSKKEMPDEFCCLFKWLTYAYGKAPKCSCNLAEVKSAKQSLANTVLDKTSGSSDINDSSKSTNTNFIDSEPSPNSVCQSSGENEVSSFVKQTEYKEVQSVAKFKPPISNSTPNLHVEKLKRSESWGKKATKSVYENNKYVKLGKPDCKNGSREEASKKAKFDSTSSRKPDKLIIKTDFLKNKNFKKDRDRSPESKSAQSANGAGDCSQTSTSQNSAREVMKKHHSKKAISENVKQPVRQHHSTERFSKSSLEKSKPFSSSLDSDMPMKSANKCDKPKTLPDYLQRRPSNSHGKGQEPVFTQTKGQEKYSNKYSHPENQKMGPNWNGHRTGRMNIKSPAKAKHISSKVSSEQATLTKNFNRLKRELSKSKSYISNNSRQISSKQSTQGRMSASNKVSDLTNSSASKDKIYLGPFHTLQSPSSQNSISLTKLEVRSAPDKSGFIHGDRRRKSFEQASRTNTSSTLVKKTSSPKMLEFKLCPELLQKSPLAHVHSEEPKTKNEQNRIEGIKSKKEAWFKDIPFKKRRLESFEEQKDQASSQSSGPTPSSPLTETDSARQYQDSKAATFQAFQKIFLEKRSRSLES